MLEMLERFLNDLPLWHLKASSWKILISSFIFASSQIFLPFTSSFLTNTLTDPFFSRLAKLSWLFYLLYFNTFSYSLINKLKVLFTFAYSLKFTSDFKLGSSSFSFSSNSHWLLFVFCEIFLEQVITNLWMSYLSNSHFIWSVYSDSNSCCCLIFSITFFICSTKSVLEIIVIKVPFPLLNSFRFYIEQKSGEWSVERAFKMSHFLT